ncbi:hypothetical protein M9458_045594, partial [Cirrhinus mrigala]
APPRPRRLPLPAANVKPSRIAPHPPRRTDPAEENDADDEGEIWYNPIPEDEEADLPHRIPVIRVQTGRASGGADGDERQTLTCRTQEESRAT